MSDASDWNAMNRPSAAIAGVSRAVGGAAVRSPAEQRDRAGRDVIEEHVGGLVAIARGQIRGA